jgi:hypothetical protein
MALYTCISALAQLNRLYYSRFGATAISTATTVVVFTCPLAGIPNAPGQRGSTGLLSARSHLPVAVMPQRTDDNAHC